MNKHVADKNVYASDVDEEKPGIISVKGSATTSVDPDIFTVKLGVRTQDENAGMALSLNSQTMERIIAAVRKFQEYLPNVSGYSQTRQATWSLLLVRLHILLTCRIKTLNQ